MQNNTIRLEISLIAPLGSLRQTDIDRAGGKAANLGELIRAGMPVPQGFAVSTAAYDLFVDLNNLRPLTLTNPLDGAAIRAAFESAPIPADVEREVLEAYAEAGEGPVGGANLPVAVRSSATAEDLPGASFAGQQDTYLNIIGTDALLDAVRRCWASLWTDRAISYRASQGIDPRTVKLAVVVQRMVEAESAGVMFTANPVSGALDETVIDATPGLGEALVSGLVTPDHYLLHRGRLGWEIRERQLGRREVVIRARSGGGVDHDAGTGASGTAPAVSDRALRRLAWLGEGIRRHFARPMDIEWAWANGEAFILQARPITALPEPPPQVNKLQRLLASNFAEMLPVRPYPLDMDMWIPALGGAVEPIFSILALRWTISDLFHMEDGVVLCVAPRLPRFTLSSLLTPVRFLGLARRYDPLVWQSDPLLAQSQAKARALETRDMGPLTWAQLIEIIDRARDLPLNGAGEVRRRYFPGAVLAVARLRLLLGLTGQARRLAALLAGVENKTLEMNRALEELAGQVRAQPTLARIFAENSANALEQALTEEEAGRAFLASLRGFLDRYGHRETVISSARLPTWKDDPAVALGVIKGTAAHPPAAQRAESSWQADRDGVLRHPLMRIGPLRRAFLHSLPRARALMQIREDTHFYATQAMPVMRRVLLELGRRLAAAGVLEQAEDVFHLTMRELEKAGDSPARKEVERLRTAARRRKDARAKLENTPLVDPRILPQSAPKGDALLSGMPGSPGVAEGTARILRDAGEFDKLQPGDVLVATFTNPAWTPLFQRAAAVIVDTGSPASHAAIVAREYGIPAVMATMTGTQTLHDGDRVRVDGSRGRVYRLDSDNGRENSNG